jgi:hypothetical protein
MLFYQQNSIVLKNAAGLQPKSFHHKVNRNVFLGCMSKTETSTKKKKKLDLRGVRQPPGILIRRRPSHAGQENPRTPAPPIHSGIEAHVRTTATGAEP